MNDWWKKACALVARAKTSQEAGELLSVLLSEAECNSVAARCAIFHHLMRGLSQREIQHKTKTSIATVSRGAAVYAKHKTVVRRYFAS